MAKFKLLNPSQRAARYADQLKKGKVVETNKALSNDDKKYRQGYLDARRHNSEAYCAKEGIPSKSRERRRAYWASKKAQQNNFDPKTGVMPEPKKTTKKK